MRPLAFAACLVALAGCSLPYQGTSFKAVPKPEKMAEGAEGGKNDQDVVGKEAAPDASPENPTGAIGRGVDPGSRVGLVFPDTTQPAQEPVSAQASTGPGREGDVPPVPATEPSAGGGVSGSGADASALPSATPKAGATPGP